MVTMLTTIPERNALLVRLISESPGKHILVLTDRREHASWLVKNLESAALYIGGMGQDALDTATKSRVVVGTFSLAQEGLDIPTLDTIFLVTPHSDVKQAIGRVLRGASRPVIWDVVDSWSILYSMWRKRLAAYREVGIPREQVLKGRCLLDD